MLRTPNLFIAGAPKCGTTALARWLGEHPEVFMSVPKEPHYFSTDLENRVYRKEGAYRELFSGATDADKVIGEASTWYLFSRVAIPNIESYCVEPRYVVMTRDPVEMVQSLYLHNVRHLHEDASSLEEAWRLEGLRRRGKRIPRTCKEPVFLLYSEVCALGRQIARMLEWVPGWRILHVELESLRESPLMEYKRALAFLGLSYDGRREFGQENAGRRVRSRVVQRMILRGGRLRQRLGIRRGLGLTRLNEERIEKGAVPRGLATEMSEVFAEDQEMLARVVGELR